MSLINQMLRDLEKRNAGKQQSPIPQIHPQPEAKSFSGIAYALPGFLSIALLAAGLWFYQSSKNPTPPVSDAVHPRQSNTAATEPPVKTEPPESVAQTKIEPSAGSVPEQIKHQPDTSPNPNPETVLSTSAPIHDQVQKKPKPATSKPVIFKKQSSQQKADSIFQQAINTASDLSAIQQLEHVIKLNPRHFKARLLLTQKWLRQGHLHKAAGLLDESLIYFPANPQLVNTRAQIYLQQNNPEKALVILQRHKPSTQNNETYLSLLAASYQQLKAFHKAADTYQQLTAINPGKAENWLGLALAHDRLGHVQPALEAYRQALSKNPLNNSIVNYIKQRLNILN